MFGINYHTNKSDFEDGNASFFINQAKKGLTIHKFGKNPDIDTGSVPENIWNGGGLYTGFDPTGAETLNIVSDSTDDDVLGIGAQTILLEGLDANYDRITEILEMDGTTIVVSTKSYIRMNRAIIKTVGSSGYNVGSITVSQTTSSDIMCVMPPQGNQTHIACYTIPRGLTGYLVKWSANIQGTGSNDADICLRMRLQGSGFTVQSLTSISESFLHFENLYAPIIIPEKSDVDLVVTRVSNNNTTIIGTFDIILI